MSHQTGKKRRTILSLYYPEEVKASHRLRIRVTKAVYETFRTLYSRVKAIKLERREIIAPRYYRQTDFLAEMLELIAQKYGLEEVLYQTGLRKVKKDEGTAF